MYEAKRKGRNGCAFFDRAIAAKAQRQVALNTRLRKAVKRGAKVFMVGPEWETTFDAMSDGIFIFDRMGELKRVNRAGAAMEAVHVLGHHPEVEAVLPPRQHGVALVERAQRLGRWR